jgi:hypothetical protein
MTRDSRYDILFEPVEIGPIRAPNRFYQVPHCKAMDVLRYPYLRKENNKTRCHAASLNSSKTCRANVCKDF